MSLQAVAKELKEGKMREVKVVLDRIKVIEANVGVLPTSKVYKTIVLGVRNLGSAFDVVTVLRNTNDSYNILIKRTDTGGFVIWSYNSTLNSFVDISQVMKYDQAISSLYSKYINS